jgi:hypothetical protein
VILLEVDMVDARGWVCVDLCVRVDMECHISSI